MWKGNRREKSFVSQGEERLLLKTWHSDSIGWPICIFVASADEQEDWDIIESKWLIVGKLIFYWKNLSVLISD